MVHHWHHGVEETAAMSSGCEDTTTYVYIEPETPMWEKITDIARSEFE